MWKKSTKAGKIQLTRFWNILIQFQNLFNLEGPFKWEYHRMVMNETHLTLTWLGLKLNFTASNNATLILSTQPQHHLGSHCMLSAYRCTLLIYSSGSKEDPINIVRRSLSKTKGKCPEFDLRHMVGRNQEPGKPSGTLLRILLFGGTLWQWDGILLFPTWKHTAFFLTTKLSQSCLT